MAPGSLYPAFLKISYHSAYAPHVQILPCNAPLSTSGATNTWTLRDHDSNPVLMLDALDDLLTEFAKMFPPEVHFDEWVLYTVPTLDGDPNFVGSGPLDIDGTASAGGWDKATQTTLTFRDTNGDLVRLVGMDTDVGGGFDRVTDPATIGLSTLVTEFTAETNPWRSRKDSRPSSFIARTATLNEKSRKNYRMA